MIFNDLLWFSMILYDLLCFLMIFNNVVWVCCIFHYFQYVVWLFEFFIVFDQLLCFIIIFNDFQWCSMICCTFQRFCMILYDFEWLLIIIIDTPVNAIGPPLVRACLWDFIRLSKDGQIHVFVEVTEEVLKFEKMRAAMYAERLTLETNSLSPQQATHDADWAWRLRKLQLWFGYCHLKQQETNFAIRARESIDPMASRFRSWSSANAHVRNLWPAYHFKKKCQITHSNTWGLPAKLPPLLR